VFNDRIDVGHDVISILESTSSSQAVLDLQPVAILMGAVLLIQLISFPLLFIWYCYKNRKMKRTFDLRQQPLRNIQRERTTTRA
jgi:hypothetical protein